MSAKSFCVCVYIKKHDFFSSEAICSWHAAAKIHWLHISRAIMLFLFLCGRYVSSSVPVLCRTCVILLLSQLWLFTRCHNVISVKVCRSLRCGSAVRIFKFSERKLLGFNSLEYANPQHHQQLLSAGKTVKKISRHFGSFKRMFPGCC